MANTPHARRPMPRTTTTTSTVEARLDALASAGICPRCQQAIAPLTDDVKALLGEVIRLNYALTETRLESANRLAAMRAALGAAGDSDTDPLDYLRWELPEPSPDAGRGRA